MRAIAVRIRGLLRAFLLVWLLSAAACTRARWPDDTPALVYLTWQGDPTTTMTVQWLAAEGVTGDDVSFGPADGSQRWILTGGHHRFPHSDRVVHVAELTGLEPGRDYRFRIGGLPEEHAFRTMPADASRPVTFIVGGDVHRRGRVDERMYRTAAAQDPMFVVLGGDLAYDNGKPNRAGRWYELLDAWQRCMVTTDGRLIPVVATIGNHEVKGRYDRTPDEAPFFYSLFPGIGQDGRQVLDFGNSMSIVLLDTGHTHSIAGEQTTWLAETLAARADVPHLFVVYHVAAFPSARRFNGGQSPVIREHWVPLFDHYDVDVVFEHHDHAYKRTHLIKGGVVSPQGVLYLGDGAWGARPRRVHRPQKMWYLDRAEPVNHVIVTTVHGPIRRHVALDPDGVVIDGYP
ncbi:MAG: purple acid phosphatase family protein [Planctomycetota bacterium]|jgi:hypothetical protein